MTPRPQQRKVVPSNLVPSSSKFRSEMVVEGERNSVEEETEDSDIVEKDMVCTFADESSGRRRKEACCKKDEVEIGEKRRKGEVVENSKGCGG